MYPAVEAAVCICYHVVCMSYMCGSNMLVAQSTLCMQDPWDRLDQSAGKDVGGQEARRIRYVRSCLLWSISRRQRARAGGAQLCLCAHETINSEICLWRPYQMCGLFSQAWPECHQRGLQGKLHPDVQVQHCHLPALLPVRYVLPDRLPLLSMPGQYAAGSSIVQVMSILPRHLIAVHALPCRPRQDAVGHCYRETRPA